MKINLKILCPLLILTLGFSRCDLNDASNNGASTILMDFEYLSATKNRIENGDPKLKIALEQLIREAEAALLEGPYSVIDKKKLPPSGDKHDYASYSRYWWPDPDQSDGLPYIRRDGETNPESQSLSESDRQRIGALGVNTETLGLAYYLTGKQKYATKAAQLLRVWFLNDETRMNPNVNHAQCRPGHNTGTKSGILDGRLMVRALEGSLLIANSSALSDIEQKRLKAWAGKYFEWLTTNDMALDEAASKNNHGSYYDAQAMYFALYSGKDAAAKKIAQKFLANRVLTQIQPDGSMPKEIARTRPLFYSVYNLHAMFLVSHLAENVDVDIWEADNTSSRLRRALDHLAPFTRPSTEWPHPTIGKADPMDMYPILKMANRVYPDGDYLKFAEELPSAECEIQRANIAFPLMR